MKPEFVLLLQAAVSGAVLALVFGALAALAGYRDVANTASIFILPGALAASAAAALMLRSWHAAGGTRSCWPATRMATYIMLHLLWILPALVGVATFILQSTGLVDVGVDVSGIGVEAAIGIILMIAAVGSAVVWGVPAYFLALLGCRRFLTHMSRVLEQRA